MKCAAFGRINRVRDFTGRRRHITTEGVHPWRRIEEHLGIGMFRCFEEFVRRRLFDKATKVKNAYSVCHMPHNSQVMRDQKIS